MSVHPRRIVLLGLLVLTPLLAVTIAPMSGRAEIRSAASSPGAHGKKRVPIRASVSLPAVLPFDKETLTVHSLKKVHLFLRVKYGGGGGFKKKGKTDAKGNWHHTWFVHARGAGPSTAALKVTHGKDYRNYTVPFEVIIPTTPTPTATETPTSTPPPTPTNTVAGPPPLPKFTITVVTTPTPNSVATESALETQIASSAAATSTAIVRATQTAIGLTSTPTTTISPTVTPTPNLTSTAIVAATQTAIIGLTSTSIALTTTAVANMTATAAAIPLETAAALATQTAIAHQVDTRVAQTQVAATLTAAAPTSTATATATSTGVLLSVSSASRIGLHPVKYNGTLGRAATRFGRSTPMVYAEIPFQAWFGDHTVTYRWYDPSGKLRFASADQEFYAGTASSGSFATMDVNGDGHADHPGVWKLVVQIDGRHALTTRFRVAR